MAASTAAKLRVVVEAELAGRDDRRQEAEHGRDVHPDRRRRASPDDSGAHRGQHRGAQYSGRPWTSARAPRTSSRSSRRPRSPSSSCTAATRRTPRSGRSTSTAPTSRSLLTLLAAVAAGVLLRLGALLRPRRCSGCVAAALLGAVRRLVLLAPGRGAEDAPDHAPRRSIEYALLAPAARAALPAARSTSTASSPSSSRWSVAASGWGLLQFLGVVERVRGQAARASARSSFLGHQDFGAFTGATLAIGLAAIALGERRRLAAVARRRGRRRRDPRRVDLRLLRRRARGARRRLARTARGTLTVRRIRRDRGHPRRRRRRRLRAARLRRDRLPLLPRRQAPRRRRPARTSRPARSERCSPTSGCGSGRTTRCSASASTARANRYQPYLAAAKRKFPDQPPQAYPSPQNPLGRAELLDPAARRRRHRRLRSRASRPSRRARDSRCGAPRRRSSSALVAAGWILVAAGTWNAVGIVAGIPLEAVTWLGLGLAAAARAGGSNERCSSPAAPASSARTSSARCSSAATRCACSTTSRPAAAQPRRARRRDRRGRAAQLRARPQRRARRPRSSSTSARSARCRARCRTRSPRARSTSRGR